MAAAFLRSLSADHVPHRINDFLESLALTLRMRDRYTDHHCNRVGLICQQLGRHCGLDSDERAELSVAARFHDIGKIGIPDRILLNNDSLDEADRQLMQSHSVRGESIFLAMRNEVATEIAKLIRHHHEAIDGSGYPDGLKQDDIPLAARILRVADSYDAMTTRRPYGKVRSHDEAMQILRDECDCKIDPQVFAEFEKLTIPR